MAGPLSGTEAVLPLTFRQGLVSETLSEQLQISCARACCADAISAMPLQSEKYRAHFNAEDMSGSFVLCGTTSIVRILNPTRM